MRLIDADALKEHFKQYAIHSGIQASLDRYALKVIEEEPTVDAVPVRHGKWIPRYIKIAGQNYKHGMQCSVCAEPALDAEGDDYLTDYCPNCGARMDAERKEECSR